MKNKLRCLTALAALLTVSGCGPDMGDDDIEAVGDGLGARVGVDYSWARPSPSGLRAAGYTFAARYLADDTDASHGKILFRPEANALRAAGVDIVSNWEVHT